jgi:hypothetical protein
MTNDNSTNDWATKATDGTMANEKTGAGRGLDRRRFLQVTGVGVGVAAAAAACVNPKTAEQITQTGTRIPAPSTSVPPFPGSEELDARLTATVLSIELLGVDLYTDVLGKGWLNTAAVSDLAKKLQDRHRTHAQLVATQLGALGQDAGAVKANQPAGEDLVDSPTDAVTALNDKREIEIEAAKVLANFEDQLAQLYTRAAGVSTTAELRSTMASLGGATARQYTAMSWPAGLPAAPFAFQRTAPAAISEDAYVAVDASRLRTPGTAATGSGTTTTTRPS